MTRKILIADDEQHILETVGAYLRQEGHQVITVRNGRDAVFTFRHERPDLVILDVMMPEMDGFTLAKEIRSVNAGIPIIFLTARTLREDMLQGFSIGADDYITKPFDSEILLFKIRAILKRAGESGKSAVTPEEFSIGKYFFSHRHRYLELAGNRQGLTPKEAELLKLLCLAGNEVLPKKEALMKIWGDDSYFTARSMDVFMARIRKYLKDDPTVEILSVHGNGYRLIR